MELAREQSCIRSLNWRTQLPDGTPVDALVQRMEKRRWKLDTKLPALVRLVDGTENEIWIVRNTNRVQIRVHYTVPEEQRARAAQTLFRELVNAVIDRA